MANEGETLAAIGVTVGLAVLVLPIGLLLYVLLVTGMIVLLSLS